MSHKSVFFAAGHANYAACLEGRLKLIPKGALHEGLRRDYEGMQVMIHGEALTFEEVMNRLQILEARINGLVRAPAAKAP